MKRTPIMISVIGMYKEFTRYPRYMRGKNRENMHTKKKSHKTIFM